MTAAMRRRRQTIRRSGTSRSFSGPTSKNRSRPGVHPLDALRPARRLSHVAEGDDVQEFRGSPQPGVGIGQVTG